MRQFFFMFATAIVLGFSCLIEVSAQGTGPRLQFDPPIVQFDTTSCGRISAVTLEIRNVGDVASTIHSVDPVGAPFTGDFAAPFSLPPGQSRQVPLTYAPDRAPRRDSLILNIVADNPVPAAMAFLFDVSSGMAESFGGTTRIEAAQAAGRAFLDRVMHAGGPAHEGGVYAFSGSAEYRLLRGFTTERNMIQGAMPSMTSGDHACTWDGMQRTITLMQTQPLRKLLIVFTGAKDAGRALCGPHSAPGVVTSATAAGIAVYPIAFSTDNEAELRDIADLTGGRYSRVTTTGELQAAMDAIVTDLQFNVPQKLVLRGEAVSPVLEYFPPHLVFPTTLVGDTVRRQLALHNVGTSRLHLREVIGLSAALSLGAEIPSAISPGDSATVEMRFHPVRQERMDVGLRVSYNACENGEHIIRLLGMGYETDNPSVGPVLVTSPAKLDFGPVSCSAAHTANIILRNTGDAVLNGSDISL
ncbi:MAG: VWA domain-containing protein, partial [Bacteroidetes bacterium]|nr:VWA domain-containing protein [Bacteroidota bacterium]